MYKFTFDIDVHIGRRLLSGTEGIWMHLNEFEVSSIFACTF